MFFKKSAGTLILMILIFELTVSTAWALSALLLTSIMNPVINNLKEVYFISIG